MKNKSAHTVAEFERKFESSPAGQERISQLKKQVAHLAGPGSIRSVSIPFDDEIILGLVSCSHIGSLYSDVSDLNYFYDHAKEQGAECVLHCGDVCDGHKMYKGQEFEQDCIGWEAQAERFEKVAPGQLPTKFITGNHDESLKKLAGMAPGPDLARRRSDWEYLGSCYARVVLNASSGRTCTMDLMHPGGGSSYALSYRPQKIIEQLEGGTKPDILAIGHFHKAFQLPSYRNICCFLTGAFQWQTPFMRDLGLAAHVGGWILRISLGKGAASYGGKFVAFYR